MKFTIEVEDFYLEEEHLAPALTAYIKDDVIRQIHTSIKERVDKQITMEVKARVEESMYRLIQSYSQTVINEGKVDSRSNKKNGEKISVAEYVLEVFNEKFSSYNDPSENIKRIALQAIEELKKRYDTLFATQIVMKMKENNMLNEQGANLLINDKQKT